MGKTDNFLPLVRDLPPRRLGHKWKLRLLDSHHRRLLPRAIERLRLRPVEAHHNEEAALGRRQPVRLFVVAWQIVLDIERQAAIGVLHELRHIGELSR